MAVTRAFVDRMPASELPASKVIGRDEVMEKFGVTLRPEPVFVGFGDDPDVSYLRG